VASNTQRGTMCVASSATRSVLRLQNFFLQLLVTFSTASSVLLIPLHATLRWSYYLCKNCAQRLHLLLHTSLINVRRVLNTQRYVRDACAATFSVWSLEVMRWLSLPQWSTCVDRSGEKARREKNNCESGIKLDAQISHCRSRIELFPSTRRTRGGYYIDGFSFLSVGIFAVYAFRA
jgi:hypothetical protein